MVVIDAWNTGCLYSKHGQRIAYTRLEDGSVAFMDYDRMINGYMEISDRFPLTRGQIMRKYLHGEYVNRPLDTEVEKALVEACKAVPSVEKRG